MLFFHSVKLAGRSDSVIRVHAIFFFLIWSLKLTKHCVNGFMVMIFFNIGYFGNIFNIDSETC